MNIMNRNRVIRNCKTILKDIITIIRTLYLSASISDLFVQAIMIVVYIVNCRSDARQFILINKNICK